MKKSVFILGITAAFAVLSCKKTDTTAADVGADPNATAVVVDNDSLPITNDSTINKVDNSLEKAKDSTGAAIKKGANEVKDAAHDATDGDGNITK